MLTGLETFFSKYSVVSIYDYQILVFLFLVSLIYPFFDKHY